MHYSPPEIDTPKVETILWRYMDIWKLVSMLESRSLRFSKVSSLIDEFEGTLPHLDTEQSISNIINECLAQGRKYSGSTRRSWDVGFGFL